MTVFALALATLHADGNLSETASFQRGAGAVLSVRIIRSEPADIMPGQAGVGARTNAVHASINHADLGGLTPRRGDRVTIGAQLYVVEDAEPDILRLSSALTLAPVASTGGFIAGVSDVGGTGTIA